ncbi:MAG: methyltransferase [Candidatus Eremiobacteraeota bacterium]|nr:methyltransferase [Candidatus Eremiobacteraeota bacterium]
MEIRLEIRNELIKILETGMGNCGQRALSVALRRHVFDRLSGRKILRSEMTGIMECPPRPARIMTDLLVAMGLLVAEDELLSLSEASETYLVSARETYIGQFLLMLDERLYFPWAELESVIEKDRPWREAYDSSSLSGEEAYGIVKKAMMGLHGLTSVTAAALASVIDLEPATTHLDLGGGTGALSIALARKFPAVRFIMADIGYVLDVARENIETAGLASRIEIVRADFFKDPLPGHPCSISLSNVLQDWPQEKKALIVSRAFDTLPAGGMLFVMECMLDDDRKGPLLSALMSLNMLIETDGGESSSVSDLRALLAGSGFVEVEFIADFIPLGILRARKPGAPRKGF